MNEPTAPRESWARRWASLLVLAVIVLIVTVFQPEPGIHSDGVGYHLSTYAILKGDLAFTWLPDNIGMDMFLIQPDVRRQRYLCKYPPGVALIRLPLMAFVVNRDRDGRPPYSQGEHWMCLVASALALMTIAGLCLRVCERLGVSLLSRHAAVLSLTFGTGLFHYGTWDAAMSHIYSALGAAVLLWIAIVAVQDRAGRLPLLLTPFVVILLLMVRNTNVLIIAFWSVGLLAWGWSQGIHSRTCWFRNALIVAAGVGIGAPLQLALNYNALGRFQLSSYAREGFDFSRLMLREVLFSYNRGLFTYYPIIGVALVAGLVVRRTRLLTVAVAMLVLAYGVLYGYWPSWYLGHGFGHRGFVDMVPLIVPVLALSLDRIGVMGRRLVFSTSVAAVMLTVVVMFGYWNGKYPHSDATQYDYYNAITFRLYKRVYRRVWGVLPPELRAPSTGRKPGPK